MSKTHYVYKITNKTTGEYYYGKRTCSGRWQLDSYMGSGLLLKKKMHHHPDHEWVKEVLLLLDTEEEAYEYEGVVVGERWKTDPLCLNLIPGGSFGASDPAYTSTKRIELWADPEYREKVVASRRRNWADPDYSGRVKCREAANRLWEDEGLRQAHSELSKSWWQDSDYRANNLKKQKEAFGCNLITADGVEVNVTHEEVRAKLEEGCVFAAKSQVYLHLDEFEVTFASRVNTARKLMLKHSSLKYGYLGEYRRIKTSEFRKLVGES